MTKRPARIAGYCVACAWALCALQPAPGAERGPAGAARVHPQRWPKLQPVPPRDPSLERRIDLLLGRMTPGQKVGQLIQADIDSIVPDDLRHYPLGSILNGGNSSPHGDKLAPPGEWLALADRFYDASLAAPGSAGIPALWGADAVHGHNNIPGATIFPHNIGLGAARDPQLIRRITARPTQRGNHIQLSERVTPTQLRDATQKLRLLVGTLPRQRPQHNRQIPTRNPTNIQRSKHNSKLSTRRHILQTLRNPLNQHDHRITAHTDKN